MTIRNLLLSLVLSLVLTFVLTALYIFYPIISLMARGMFSSEPHSDGIAVVAGGTSAALVWTMPLLAGGVLSGPFCFASKKKQKKLRLND